MASRKSELLQSKQLVPKKDSKSKVWNYFGFRTDQDGKVTNSSQVICAVCDISLTYSGNTTNLRNHIRKHPREYREFLSSEGKDSSKSASQPTQPSQSTSGEVRPMIDSVYRKAGQYASSSTVAKGLTKAVAYHLARDMKPIYTVEEPGFVKMLQKFEPRYVLPSRKVFSSSIIPQMYEDLRSSTVAPFAAASTVYALTSDLWTARNMTQFLGVTFHAINAEWELKSFTLENTECPPPHTADCIAASLKSVLEEWNLQQDRLFSIVTDNASNITKAVRDLGWNHLPCFGHCLNLVVRAGLDTRQVHTTLARCTKLVELTHRSANASYKLAEKQEMLDLPKNKLVQDVRTRWNSTLDMLARITQQQQAICSMLLEVKRQELMPSAEEFQTIEQLVDLLNPVKEMTEFFSGTYVTVSGLLPCISRLETSFLVKETDTAPVKAAKQAMSEKLGDVYNHRYAEDTLRMCTFLDPRFKSLPFLESLPGVIASVHDLARRKVTELAEKDQDSSDVAHGPTREPPAKKSKITSIFGDMYQGVSWSDTSSLSPDAVAAEEVRRYVAEPSIPLDDDALSWWKQNAPRFKFLGKAARHFLCIPATSVPSERLFSTAGNIVSAKRACLKPSNIRYLTFLHDNLK